MHATGHGSPRSVVCQKSAKSFPEVCSVCFCFPRNRAYRHSRVNPGMIRIPTGNDSRLMGDIPASTSTTWTQVEREWTRALSLWIAVLRRTLVFKQILRDRVWGICLCRKIQSHHILMSPVLSMGSHEDWLQPIWKIYTILISEKGSSARKQSDE